MLILIVRGLSIHKKKLATNKIAKIPSDLCIIVIYFHLRIHALFPL